MSIAPKWYFRAYSLYRLDVSELRPVMAPREFGYMAMLRCHRLFVMAVSARLWWVELPLDSGPKVLLIVLPNRQLHTVYYCFCVCGWWSAHNGIDRLAYVVCRCRVQCTTHSIFHLGDIEVFYSKQSWRLTLFPCKLRKSYPTGSIHHAHHSSNRSSNS